MSTAHMDRLTGEEARACLEKSRIAILPIGAVEFHGPHLPLGTDNFIILKLAEEVAERTGGLLLPLMPYGQVWSLENFPGTLTVSNDTLVSLLYEIGYSLHRNGAAIFAILNGHVGNITAIQAAARRLEKIDGLVTYTFTYPGLSEASAQVCSSRPLPGGYFHADEIETSLMLYAQPDAVHMERAIRDIPRLPPDFHNRPVRWDEITDSGVLGDATAATQAKGEGIFHIVANNILEILEHGRKRFLEA